MSAGDDAMTRAEFFLDLALATRPAVQAVLPTGLCLNINCEAALDEGKRWCGSACRDAWERGSNRRH